ncbi:MAG TPA: transglycosylase SLT domain-containing protein [Thermoanaerobaculia bacterium]|jgi:soluble lytic murein transglycosylase-like protein
MTDTREERPRRRKPLKPLLILAAAVVAIAAIAAIYLARQRVQRHRVFRTTGGEVKPAPPAGFPPLERWSEAFQQLPPSQLDDLLDELEKRHPNEYKQWSLGYLHARALIEENDRAEAERRLAPFLVDGNRFRDLALYHRVALDDAGGDEAAASRSRQELIFKYPDAMYRDPAIDEELDYLATLEDTKPLLVFAMRLNPTGTAQQRRDTDARIVSSLVRAGDEARALATGLPLLRANATDDASDRISRALDRPELIKRMTPEQWALMGETFRNHRHYDRAVALLSLAIPRLPARQDDLRFALGRSYFGNEQFVEAQRTYLAGAAATQKPDQKVTFFWHAARAAQLRGDDATAERLMTQAIAVPGKFPATLAALTQRLRTRLRAGRMAEAQSDLALLRKMAPNERAVLEGSLAYAIGMVARNQPAAATGSLNAIPRALLDGYDEAELSYWRARALETADPATAFREYLSVLRSDVPAHFAYFSRRRLDSPSMAPRLTQELTRREAQVRTLIAEKKFDEAKEIQTDRVLLSSRDHAKQLEILRGIYQQLPSYKAVLALEPHAFPKFPMESDNRALLLMAMGLYDEAVDDITRRWDLRPAKEALTRSLALNRGSASRESIYAIEVMMNRVPKDFYPELLPRSVRELLYPRYFEEFIAADAKRFGADPTLVLSIMREESRFNPRAKSVAAARGLLQFIITTAREIGRGIGLVDVDPEDLYDPRVIIQLGAKYVSELSKQLGGNRYRVAAAYNAGPKQVALWSRMQPGHGDDYFLSSVNFDETKHYIRKVMNSYERYNEIYGGGGPAGGIRAEP